MRTPPLVPLRWVKAYRIVASRYPPVSLFDDVTDPAQLEIVLDVEGLTNPRLRNEVGDIRLVPPDQQVCGSGTTPIMAAFTHLDHAGSRFTDGSSFGVFYCAHRQATAMAETIHHRERILREGKVGSMDVDMRCYVTSVRGQVCDARVGFDALHDPDSYIASQAMGATLRNAGRAGIVYRSVRDPGGECVAAFTPKLVAPCVQSAHFIYRWDGTRIAAVLNVTEVTRSA